MARKGGLGKGLDSLISSEYKKKNQETIGDNSKEVVEKKTKLSTKTSVNVEKHVDNPNELSIKDSRMVKLKDVEPNKEQPRKVFDGEALEELTESIRQYGVLQPLLVKPKGKRFVVIAGERRWRAAKAAGLKEIPVIIKDLSEKEIMEISLIENIQREDLNVIEEAKAYQKLISEFNYRQEDLAARISRSRTAITNRLRLLKLSEPVQEMLMAGSISEGHARALLPLEKEDVQVSTAGKIISLNLSVRETEKLVKSILEPAKEGKDDWRSADQFIYDKWEEELNAAMGTKVSIQRKKKDKGQITIDYYSVDELERLLELLKSHA